MGLALMRPSLPHIISKPATLGELASNITEATTAATDRIKMIPTYKAARMPHQITRMKTEAAAYLKMSKRFITQLEKEIQ
jgi:hypothetical protein